MRARVLAALLFMLCSGSLIAENAKPRIAIKTFENPANYQNSTIGNALTEILTTELGKTGKFRIVERDSVAELMKEIDFGKTDWSRKPTFAKKGQFAGAEYFLLGKVTNFGYKEQEGQAQVSDYRGTHLVTIYVQHADVRVDFRIVNIATGETVLTEAGNAHEGNQSYVSEIAVWNRLLASGSFATAELSSSLIGRASVKAVNDAVRKINDMSKELRDYSSKESVEAVLGRLGEATGKILAEVGPEQYVVSLGTGDGLMRGERLTVSSEILTENKKGEVIYRERKMIGRLEVIDISMEDRSKARFVESAEGGSSRSLPHEGDIVQVDLEYGRALRGESKAALPASNAGTMVGPRSSGSSEAQDLIKQGDRYLEDEHYAQALDYYQRAIAIEPDNPELLDRMAGAQFYLRDFLEGETTAEKILSQGNALKVTIAHNHSFGSCTGELIIERGRLSFHTKKGEHDFSLDPPSVVGVNQGALPHSNLPMLIVRWRGPDGKEKKYDMLIPGFLKFNRGEMFLYRAFSGDAQSIKDTEKLNRIIMRFIQNYVK